MLTRLQGEFDQAQLQYRNHIKTLQHFNIGVLPYSINLFKSCLH